MLATSTDIFVASYGGDGVLFSVVVKRWGHGVLGGFVGGDEVVVLWW